MLRNPANYKLQQCRNIRGITESCQFCEFISRCQKEVEGKQQ